LATPRFFMLQLWECILQQLPEVRAQSISAWFDSMRLNSDGPASLIVNPVLVMDQFYHHSKYLLRQQIYTVVISSTFLLTNFSYECRFGSFFYVHVTRNAAEMTFVRKTRAKKSLTKLTPGLSAKSIKVWQKF